QGSDVSILRRTDCAMSSSGIDGSTTVSVYKWFGGTDNTNIGSLETPVTPFRSGIFAMISSIACLNSSGLRNSPFTIAPSDNLKIFEATTVDVPYLFVRATAATLDRSTSSPTTMISGNTICEINFKIFAIIRSLIGLRDGRNLAR